MHLFNAKVPGGHALGARETDLSTGRSGYMIAFGGQRLHEHQLRRLLRHAVQLPAGVWARPVRVEGGHERWWVHRDVLGLLEQEWRPRTTLLSPFDNLICDQDRTERLWGFAYRNEMYVPKHKRKFGCYVMPVLAGERLIGRVVPRMDRRRGELVVEGVFAEPEFAGKGAVPGHQVAAAVESLASFAGAASVSYSGRVAFGVC